MTRFDVPQLRSDIVKTWGPAGAHVDLFDELVRRAMCDCYPDPRDHEEDCGRR